MEPLAFTYDWILDLLNGAALLNLDLQEDAERSGFTLRSRRDAFPDRTVEGCERAVGGWFEIVRRQQIPVSPRVPFELRRR
jgi:hypothetical protein